MENLFKNDSISYLIEIIQQGYDIESVLNLKDYNILSYNPNLLMVSCFFGSYECFSYLLSNGCDIQKQDKKGL